MDWLTRLPWIGPRIAAAMRTHGWRAFAHLQTVHWTRLAAAMTFTSFLSLFPLLAVVAAIGAALLSQHQLDTLQHKISDQIPGIADQLDINGLVANAGTIGGIAGAALLFTGIGWVGSLRDCLRAVWDKDDEERNPVVAKLVDGGILLGLGAAALLSLAASGFATAAVDWTVHKAGLADHGPGRALLTVLGFCIAVLADFLILTYLLTLLPGVEPSRRAVVQAAFIGAVGFELLKVLLSGYLQGVAGKNVYGAFGTPVALLLWINFMAKLLLYCAAWTATPRHAPPPEKDGEDGGDGGGGDAAGEPGEGVETVEVVEVIEVHGATRAPEPVSPSGAGSGGRDRTPDRTPDRDRDQGQDQGQGQHRDAERDQDAGQDEDHRRPGTAAGGASVPR